MGATQSGRWYFHTGLFDLRVANAANEPLAQHAEIYRSALELVTGKAFTYPSRARSSFGWIDNENLLSKWEVKIQGSARQYIETYLSIDAREHAIEVANHVLLALPLNAPLTEALLRARAATGDLRSVDTVYLAHVETCDGLCAPSQRSRGSCFAGSWPTSAPDTRPGILVTHRRRCQSRLPYLDV